jgi:hypothetical protein
VDDLVGESLIDPTKLEDFERPVPTAPMKRLAWSIEKYEVAQLIALSRLTIKEVAVATKVPESVIYKWKRHPDFQEYMNTITLEQADNFKAKRLQILSKVLDARLEQAERAGSYALLSTKDTLDILSEMRKETETSSEGDQSNFMKTITSLIEKTSKLPALPEHPTQENIE